MKVQLALDIQFRLYPTLGSGRLCQTCPLDVTVTSASRSTETITLRSWSWADSTQGSWPRRWRSTTWTRCRQLGKLQQVLNEAKPKILGLWIWATYRHWLLCTLELVSSVEIRLFCYCQHFLMEAKLSNLTFTCKLQNARQPVPNIFVMKFI